MPLIKDNAKVENEQLEKEDKAAEEAELLASNAIETDAENAEIESEEYKEQAENKLLKLAMKTHMGSCLKTVDALFVYPLPENGNKEIVLTLVADYSANNTHLIRLGNKADFEKKDFWEMFLNFGAITKIAKTIMDQLIEEAKIKEAEKQQKKKETPVANPTKGQLSIINEEEEDKDSWLDTVMVGHRLFCHRKGEFLPYKISVKSYGIDNFQISFNNKNYFSEFDVLMLYTKFDSIINRYLD